jgi:hypothetical protein
MKKFFLIILGLACILDVSIHAAPSSALKRNRETGNLFDPLLSRTHYYQYQKLRTKSKETFFRGPIGPIGLQGPAGPAGSQGPTGPAGAAAPSNFVFLYVLQGDNLTVLPNGMVSFLHTSSQNGSIECTSPDTIVITQPGTYQVTFGVGALDASLSFTLEKNGLPIRGGTHNGGNVFGISGLTIDVVITDEDLNPSAKLNLVFTHGSGSNIDDSTNIGIHGCDDPNATTAFIKVHQIL